ncbi:MAG: bifunctional phosphoglucose/phosphomannose isomerase [Balneolaceae bacterium]|nr:bifunctional phosphoglucose/phosphomannose isomerase [Balneolaceae bacterium]
MANLTKQDIERVDTENMWKLLKGFSDQWNETVKLTDHLKLQVDKDRIRNVCFAGMGGSAIGADIMKAYSYGCSPVPVKVVRNYEIPSWVGDDTLFIACSFSGNTEETLSAAGQAQEAGAQLVAVTSGGQLMVRAMQHEFDYIKLPGGIPPRTALGYLFVSIYRIFQYIDFLDEGDQALIETGQLLAEQQEVLSNTEDNEALNLARELIDSLPIIYSDSILMEPVNLRWRGQFEENAKTLAFGNLLPEMNHNEIVGWDHIAHLTGRLSVIMLIDRKDDERVRKRMRIVKELIDDQVSSLTVLKTRGESRLTRMFSLIQLADWTSFYLAMLNGVDPTPIAKIDLLKSKLAEE